MNRNKVRRRQASQPQTRKSKVDLTIKPTANKPNGKQAGGVVPAPQETGIGSFRTQCARAARKGWPEAGETTVWRPPLPPAAAGFPCSESHFCLRCHFPVKKKKKKWKRSRLYNDADIKIGTLEPRLLQP